MVKIYKRKKFNREDYDDTLKSTRMYYDEYAEDYVKYYDNWLKAKAEFSDPKYREGYETVAKTLSKIARSGERVVDVGCGVGKWSALMAEKEVYVTCVDNLSIMLKKITQRSKQGEIEPRISLVLADGFYLPFRDEVFDGATLNWVLAHIPVIKNVHFIKEVGRVVRPKGWVLISDSFWRGQEGGKEQIQTREIKGKKYEVYKYYYEPEELRFLLEKNFGQIELLKPLYYEIVCITRKTI